MKRSPGFWVGVLVAVCGGAYLAVRLQRRSCAGCTALATQGAFALVLAESKVCKACVQEGMRVAPARLEEKMQACDAAPTAECQQEIATYWHDLFRMAKQVDLHEELGQQLIDMRVANNPTLLAWESRKAAA